MSHHRTGYIIRSLSLSLSLSLLVCADVDLHMYMETYEHSRVHMLKAVTEARAATARYRRRKRTLFVDIDNVVSLSVLPSALPWGRPKWTAGVMQRGWGQFGAGDGSRSRWGASKLGSGAASPRWLRGSPGEAVEGRQEGVHGTGGRGGGLSREADVWPCAGARRAQARAGVRRRAQACAGARRRRFADPRVPGTRSPVDLPLAYGHGVCSALAAFAPSADADVER